MAPDLRSNTKSDLKLSGPLRDHALFLDVDGTLLPIVARPHDVQVSADLLALLEQLQGELLGAIALVSGRAIADLDGLFAPLLLPTAGVHGLERRSQIDTYASSAKGDALDDLRPVLSAYVERHPGLLLEDKKLSLALHYRLLPEQEAQIESLISSAMRDTHPSLELTRGKMVFEVKPGGINKGTAIQDFMTEAPFRGRRPIFIGDDATDEDGFLMVNQMNGISVRVGTKEASRAGHSLPDEVAVHAWLKDLIANAATA